MDLILATDWINNAYPEMDLQDTNKENKEPTKKADDDEDPSWISLIDEEMKREPLAPIGTPKKCVCAERRRPVPLVDHLCKRFKCSAHELHVLFKSIEKRRDIVEHLRSVQLRTAHLRPSVRNFPVRCNDLSILDTHSAPFRNRGFGAIGGGHSIETRPQFWRGRGAAQRQQFRAGSAWQWRNANRARHIGEGQGGTEEQKQGTSRNTD
ncbi:hypothetical protein niasHT_026043 [Heterodera trifolii]|uniref:Uncharacterized protein n=1 Tax=Heterodera trifolii TaxID=157864 RepID=A0ABD2KIY5_9BILA